MKTYYRILLISSLLTLVLTAIGIPFKLNIAMAGLGHAGYQGVSFLGTTIYSGDMSGLIVVTLNFIVSYIIITLIYKYRGKKE